MIVGQGNQSFMREAADPANAGRAGQFRAVGDISDRVPALHHVRLEEVQQDVPCWPRVDVIAEDLLAQMAKLARAADVNPKVRARRKLDRYWTLHHRRALEFLVQIAQFARHFTYQERQFVEPAVAVRSRRHRLFRNETNIGHREPPHLMSCLMRIRVGLR